MKFIFYVGIFVALFVVVNMAALKMNAKQVVKDKHRWVKNKNHTDDGEPLNEIDFYNANLLKLGEESEILLYQATEDPILVAGLFEGDIDGIKFSDSKLGGRNAILDLSTKWENGEIPYVISNSFAQHRYGDKFSLQFTLDSAERSTIAKAINEYHSRTCLRFLPRKGQNDYIRIVKGNGCSSSVGRKGGEQEVSLGGGCAYFGIIVHELMHAAGFWHEQSRADRDDHVSILWNNIIRGMEYNFQKYSWKEIQNLDETYDLGSVMHYDGYAFSSRRGQPTIVAKGANGQRSMGQRRGFSDTDLRKINKLYKCGDVGGSGSGGQVVTPKGDCKDGHKRCAEWSKRGECKANPSWMNVNCLNACNVCETVVGKCLDLNEKCGTWASTGECKKNPDYMHNFCKKSCKQC